MKIAILGGGAFGTSLACSLAANGQSVTLWSRSSHQTKQFARTRQNPRLPDIILDDLITPTSDMADITDAACVLLAVPAQQTQILLERYAAHFPDVPLVACAKGIDLKNFQTQTEAIHSFLPDAKTAVLTGPGFAQELAAGKPTALTLACAQSGVGIELQGLLSTERLRLYLTSDMIGAQLGGALKNVIAIAAGIVIGAGLGESARAALLTRGFAEMRRLGVALGGQEETFSGLSGLGDLVLTASSPQSRNYAQGLALGSGQGLKDGITTEGIHTASAACRLAERKGIEVPITQAVADILSGNSTIEQAMATLLSRPLKQE